jgi:DNA-binding CsgD family transcriptional regulator
VPAYTIERETELAHMSAALAAAAGGDGRLVVVEGPAGIGKTRLIAEAQALAKQQGFARVRAVGDEPERSLPWGVVRQMAERSLLRYGGEVRERILAGPAGAALRSLEEVAERGADEVALARTLHKLWWVAADLSSERPLLITVDDAQWADLPSLRFLAYLSRRLGDLSIALIVGTRPVESPDGPLAELATARTGDHLVPAPLSVEGVRALTGERVAAPVAAALHAASGGNPFFAEQLTAELVRGGHDPADPRSAHAVGALAPRTVARVMLARQGPDEAALAAAAAILGARSDPVLAARLAKLDGERAPAAADALRREHVLTDDPTTLEFRHPVLREAVLAGVAPSVRARLHERAAVALHERGAPAERIAVHLLDAPRSALPDAAAILRVAAGRSMATGDAASAAALLRCARDEGVDDDALDAELGRALLESGEPGAARALLLDAAGRAAQARERAERLALAAEATARIHGPAAASAEIRAAIAGWTAGIEERLALDARLGIINSYALGGAHGSEQHLAAFADLPGRSSEERVLLGMLAQRLLYVPRPATEVRAVALRALDGGALAGDPRVDLLAWSIAVHALICAEAIDACEAEIAAARARVAAGGAPADFGCIGMTAAYVGWRVGDLRRAEAEAMATLEALSLVDAGPLRDALRAVATRHAVHAQIEQGRLADARATLAAHDAQAPADAEPSVPVSRLRLARAALALASGDPGTALAQARRLGREEQAADAHSPIIAWRGLAAIALGRLGRVEEGRALAADHAAAARTFGAVTEVGAALRIEARLEPADRLERLDEAVTLLEVGPGRLELAGALADLGEALGVTGRRSDARAPLTRALELAEACGARTLAQRAVDGLSGLGDRPRRIVEAGVDELTASERRVAQLAAGGRTNREIAQELFVTPKTVETHLSHAYAKLRVGGRRELAGALA